MRIHQFLIALSAIVCTSTAAIAGTVEIIPSVVARFDNAINFNPLPLTSPPGGPIVDGPGLYQVDFALKVSDLTGDETCFACAAFDIELSEGFADEIVWLPDFPNVDPPGPGPIVPQWSLNQYLPIDSRIVICNNVGGPLAADDPRLSIGELGPEFFGSALVQWNGGGIDALTVANLEYSFRTVAGVFSAPQTGPDVAIQFGIPEPAGVTMAMFVLVGMLGYLRTRN